MKVWLRASGLRGAALVIAAALTARCGDVNAALGQITESQRLAADLRVAFTKAADASNRAVMADTDELSVADAHAAETAKHAVHTDIDALTPLLKHLGYAEESGLLQDVTTKFAAYESLDRRILDLAVENTNLKAQRLSFGPAQAAADAFADAVNAVAGAKNPWQVKALAATAIASVREIQALQAPHIAEAEDASMTRLEQRMAAAARTAKESLASLTSLVPTAAAPRLAAAATALDTFMDLNAQVLALSHRNTNVHSLALSLDQKRKLTPPCDDAIGALQAALERHGYRGGLHPGGR